MIFLHVMKKKIEKDYPPVSEMNNNQRIEIVKDIFLQLHQNMIF